MKKPPPVKFASIEPLQGQYHDGSGAYWNVARLIDATKELKSFDAPLASLDLRREIWEGSNMADLAYHCRKVAGGDLSKPIIIAWDGSIADGRHRIIKALVEGKRTIKAVRMSWKPTPCGETGD